MPQPLMVPTHEKNEIFFTLFTEYCATAHDSGAKAFEHPSLQPQDSVSHKARPTLPGITVRLPAIEMAGYPRCDQVRIKQPAVGQRKRLSGLKQSDRRGISSVGRALAWHARGQGFKSPILHCGFAAIEQESGESSEESKNAAARSAAVYCQLSTLNSSPGRTIAAARQ